MLNSTDIYDATREIMEKFPSLQQHIRSDDNGVHQVCYDLGGFFVTYIYMPREGEANCLLAGEHQDEISGKRIWYYWGSILDEFKNMSDDCIKDRSDRILGMSLIDSFKFYAAELYELCKEIDLSSFLSGGNTSNLYKYGEF